MYHDRPSYVRHYNRYDYTYRDYLGVLRYRVIWPRYRFIVHYDHSPWFSWRYFYPYYHRKYIFISLGGYWPSWYHHRRYYWYGCHPNHWYGYYPVAREVQGPTYNYYTYNYYTDTSDQAADPAIFEQIGAQEQGPDQTTLADVYFEEAVKAFEAGKYQTASTKFARAMELAPDDQILPFAYSQALIAVENYPVAAQVLREALVKVRPEQEGVFYPRGLYADDDTLLDQIDQLSEKAELYGYDADLQLLLGYQLLGIGEVDRAVDPLILAKEDLVNAKAAGVLLNLAEKIKISEIEKEDAQPVAPPQSKAMIEKYPLESEETVLVSDTKIEDSLSENQELHPSPATNEITFAKETFKPEEMIYIEDIKAIEEKPEKRAFSPVLAKSPVIQSERPTKWKRAMFLASVCAIATSAGIRGYIRG